MERMRIGGRSRARSRNSSNGAAGWLKVQDRPIATRITLILAIGIIGLLVMATITMRAESRIEQAFQKAEAHNEVKSLVDEIRMLSLELRRREKDFLLRTEMKYVELGDQARRQLKKKLQRLDRSKVVSTLASKIGTLEDTLDRYSTKFGAVVNYSRRLGLTENEGLRGELRKAAHGIEDGLKSEGNADLVVDLLMLRRHEKDFMLRFDPKYVTRYDQVLEELKRKFVVAQSKSLDSLQVLLSDYAHSMHAYVETRNELATGSGELTRIYAETEPLFAILQESARRGYELATTELRDVRASMQRTIAVTVVLVLGLFIGSGIVLTLSITRPLRALTSALSTADEHSAELVMPGIERGDEIGDLGRTFSEMIRSLDERGTELQRNTSQLRDSVSEYSKFIEAVADGDLTGRLQVAGDGELSRLGTNLNLMTERLSSMASQIREASGATVSTLEQVRGAVTSQSAGASQQASAVSQTTSTLEEIRATSQQTLEKSTLLRESAERTDEEGRKGLQAVTQAIRGMQEIRTRVETIAETILALSGQTQQIGEITEVVNKLAQQSKMLALNASIEAAKAGDAGKGFAVVAAEVRELSEQSEQCTAQVQQILQEIRHAADKAVMATEEGTKGVDHGLQLTVQTEEAVRRLSEVIEETGTASQQIVAAVRQEAAGIDQIATAMSEINKVTHQFVASTRQSSEATTHLAAIASQLSEKVKVYKI